MIQRNPSTNLLVVTDKDTLSNQDIYYVQKSITLHYTENNSDVRIWTKSGQCIYDLSE